MSERTPDDLNDMSVEQVHKFARKLIRENEKYLDALYLAQRELREFYLDKDSEALRVIAEVIKKAT